MDFLPILFIIIAIACSVASKAARSGQNGKQPPRETPGSHAAPAQTQAAAARARQTAYPAWTCPTCGTTDNTGKFCILCGTRRIAAVQAERPQGRPSTPKTPVQHSGMPLSARVAPTPLHVVEATSLGGHTHVESSITGIQEDCPATTPVTARVPKEPAVSRQQAAFHFDPAQMRNAVLYSEILGKPKALRKHT